PPLFFFPSSLTLEWQQLRKWGRGRFPSGAIPAPLPPRLPEVHSQQYCVFLPKPRASACPAHGEKPGVDPAQNTSWSNFSM
uniref:Uncharacterized protein n=1 Tax=Cairina moschata TaxID=8855 RepID=A0A8C3CGC0_CAIMO